MYKYLCLVIVLLVHSTSLFAYDNKKTHPALTDKAAKNTVVATNLFLTEQLGFLQGYDQKLNNGSNIRTITKWLQDGSKEEDEPNCRAANHFHDPLKPWEESQLTDAVDWIDGICNASTPFKEKNSNISWATGIRNPAGDTMPADVNGTGPGAVNGRNWFVARDFYYKALTETDRKQREAYFAETFHTLGYVLHLLEDMAVPAHTRNDFSEGHSQAIGCPDGGWFCGKEWVGNPYEGYVRDHFDDEIFPLISADISKPFTGEKKLTNFWDTETHVPGTTPTNFAGQDLGLAEYTNSNFVSYATVFKRASEDPLHTYPYPARSSMTVGADQVDLRLYEITAKDGHIDKGVYVTKTGQGESITHFLKPRYVLYGTDWETNERYDLRFTMDDQCFKDYAVKLLPRAIGYASGLLDYFFRGSMEITLPANQYHFGVYAMTTDPESGFTRIVLNAENDSADNEEMSDGSIELVVKYKLAQEDPFLSASYPLTISEDFSYIVVPEANNIRTVPRDNTVELEFNLSQNPVPLWATDVSIDLVYKGVLGAETDAVVVGHKDISEPTPIDIFSNLDKHCINGQIYDAGSPEAIAQVDTNGNGEIDPNTEVDVYPHDLENLYLRISSIADPQYPLCTDNDLHITELHAGEFIRAGYILGDDEYTLSNCDIITGFIHPHPDDHTTGGSVDQTMQTFAAIKNQTDLADPAFCIAHGVEPPCYIRNQPGFTSFRGVDIWQAMIFTQGESWGWDDGSSCSFYDLQE